MGKTMDEHFKRLNPTGVKWEDMTEAQQEELREQWDKIVSVPKNLNCTCPRTGCRNNRNCRSCVALHRYYDGFSDCFRRIDEKMQEGVPLNKRYNMHKKIQAEGFEEVAKGKSEEERAELKELLEHDPDKFRELLMNRRQDISPEKRAKMGAKRWAEIVADPENTKCSCPRTDCWYHGNCVKCAALHRYYDGFPHCLRYIADEIDTIVEDYNKSIEE